MAEGPRNPLTARRAPTQYIIAPCGDGPETSMPHCPPNSTAFNFESHRVRVVMDEHGVPWFVAADVLAALDLDRTALERLDDDEKGMNTIPLGGPQDTATISEPGVYSLVATSCKVEAKRFKRWVTYEVLPSIRKTDSYTVPMAALAEAVATRFLGAGLAPWTKRFPDEFYRLIFQLHGWSWGGRAPRVRALSPTTPTTSFTRGLRRTCCGNCESATRSTSLAGARRGTTSISMRTWGTPHWRATSTLSLASCDASIPGIPSCCGWTASIRDGAQASSYHW